MWLHSTPGLEPGASNPKRYRGQGPPSRACGYIRVWTKDPGASNPKRYRAPIKSMYTAASRVRAAHSDLSSAIPATPAGVIHHAEHHLQKRFSRRVHNEMIQEGHDIGMQIRIGSKPCKMQTPSWQHRLVRTYLLSLLDDSRLCALVRSNADVAMGPTGESIPATSTIQSPPTPSNRFTCCVRVASQHAGRSRWHLARSR